MGEFITRDGCTLRYRDTGAAADPDAETVVLVPGWSQTAAMYDRLLDEMGDRYRMIAYDHRNHGQSGACETGARIATLGTDVRELLDHLNLGAVHLVGSSMGCSVLYSYMDNYGTGRVTSLALIDQPTVTALVPWLGKNDAAEVGAIMDFAGAEAFVRNLLGPDSDTTRREFLRSMLSRDMPEDDFTWLLQQNMTLRMPFGARLVLDHVMQDWRDMPARIDVPTLVTAGERSHVDPVSQKWIADQIPGAWFHIFSSDEGGDHFPFFANPQGFAAVYTHFLESVR